MKKNDKLLASELDKIGGFHIKHTYENFCSLSYRIKVSIIGLIIVIFVALSIGCNYKNAEGVTYFKLSPYRTLYEFMDNNTIKE